MLIAEMPKCVTHMGSCLSASRLGTSVVELTKWSLVTDDLVVTRLVAACVFSTVKTGATLPVDTIGADALHGEVVSTESAV